MVVSSSVIVDDMTERMHAADHKWLLSMLWAEVEARGFPPRCMAGLSPNRRNLALMVLW